jgi:DNA topoisomerase VI subunit A
MTSGDSAALFDLSRTGASKRQCKSPLTSPFKLRQLSQTVYLLNTVHRLATANRHVNQRELFYRALSEQSAPTFADQSGMNRALFCLLNAIKCDRHELGIFTTARGLVAGDPATTTILLDASTEFIADISDHPDGLSISDSLVAFSTIQTTAKFVLIVEKETVFQTLLACDSFFAKNACILVTARGYPDNITVRFLRRLLTVTAAQVPFMYLGDCDPHGVSIALVFNRALDNQMRWIGVHVSDVQSISHERVLGLKMKASDTALLNSLIENEATPDHFKTELAKLETRGLKYEVECLHSVGDDFLASQWLPRKIADALLSMSTAYNSSS